MKDTIEIKKSLIPYTFNILLAGEEFTIRVDYNKTADMFVLRLEKDGEVICAGEPIVYGVPLWKDVFLANKYPALTITPLDEAKEMNAVTYGNLNETVFLIIDNGSDEDE